MRIAIATARGLAAATGLPAVGIGTLAALARGIAEAGAEGDLLPVLDGFRGEVFAALYSPGGEPRWEPFVCRPEELVERVATLASPPATAGPGAVRFRNELAPCGVRIADDADPVHRIAARHVCALAEEAGGADGGGFEPIYLRPPDAERWRERDSFQTAE